MNDNPQREHYLNIHDEYSAHYYDATSMRYRKHFIYSYLFKNLDLNDFEVADLASGIGANSMALLELFPHAKVTGYDISPAACREYRKNLERPAFEIDLSKPYLEAVSKYDVVIIIGGLHHCVADLKTTLENIAKMLKPEGRLLMFEPNKDFFLERLRKLWYEKDSYFEENSEEALSHKEILALTEGNFDVKFLKYIGGPAYFLILNSMIFRIPLGLKKWISPPLMLLEYLYLLLPGSVFFPAFIAQWQRLR